MVLGGGGALGAFQAGVIRALHEAGLAFDVISATSIGTMNALAWNLPEVLEEFDSHWIENVRRLKPFDPARILSARNPFQFHKSLEAIADTYRGRYPWNAQRTEVLVTLTDYDTNKAAVISTRDDRLSSQERELLMKASTAILHIGSAPVQIQGRRYYDGGYLDNVPIAPLLPYNLDEIWILPLSPVKSEAGPGKTSRIARAARRFFKNPYIHSLVCLYEQTIDPPDVHLGGARKFILSPRTEYGEGFGPVQGLLFSIPHIEDLLTCGFAAGRRAAREYRESMPARKPPARRSGKRRALKNHPVNQAG